MNEVAHFLKKHYDGKSPLLLALSGGSDSLALFAILRSLGVPFQVAHVDHGWREESRAQSEILRKMVKEVPFHLKRLEGVPHNENAAREARLHFFKELQQERGFQAVLLGHHADDQAETVLKRIFEGSHLSHVEGMKEVSVIDGVTLWRPLLKMTKKTLESYLEQEPLEDSSNNNPAYLRNRMRLTMIPCLEESFGKNIASNLQRFGERAQEINKYFDWRLASYESRVMRSPLGLCFDFSDLPVESSLEWEWLIKKRMAGITELPRLMEALLESKSNVQIAPGLFVDRRRLFWLEAKRGEWQAEISHEAGPQFLGWKEMWRGELCALLPTADFRLIESRPSLPLTFSSKKLGEWWSRHKVPAFLRPLAPVVEIGGKVGLEFLTGHSFPHSGSVHLRLKLV